MPPVTVRPYWLRSLLRAALDGSATSSAAAFVGSAALADAVTSGKRACERNVVSVMPSAGVSASREGGSSDADGLPSAGAVSLDAAASATGSENSMGGGLRALALGLGEGRRGEHPAGERGRQAEAQKRDRSLLSHGRSPSLAGRRAPLGCAEPLPTCQHTVAEYTPSLCFSQPQASRSDLFRLPERKRAASSRGAARNLCASGPSAACRLSLSYAAGGSSCGKNTSRRALGLCLPIREPTTMSAPATAMPMTIWCRSATLKPRAMVAQ